MFEPSVNQITSAYMGNPGALQAKVQQEQKGNPGIPADLRDLLALQDIQQQQAAYQRQQAMNQQSPPTVAEQLMQALQQPTQQGAPQGAPQGASQGAPQMPQGMPQAAPPSMPPSAPQGIAQGMSQDVPQPEQRPGIQQLQSNIGQHMSGGGIVAFAEGEEVLSERDKLRRMEAAYDPAVTEALNKANTMPPAYTMPAELIQRARDIEARALNENPEQAKASAIREYQREVGNRDTSQYDRLIAEYENRKKQLEGPKPGIDALMEYLGQIAATPRGKTWMESGSMAARAQNDLNAQRQAQQFELTKQAIDAAQKKADITFGEKKDLFGLGRAAYDQAYKANYEVALKMTQNAFEAEKLAKQMTDNELNRASKEKIQELDRASNEMISANRNATSIATANAPGQSERETNRIMALIQKGTPEALAEAKQRQEIYGSITGSGAAGVGAAKNLTRQLQMSISGYEKEINPLTNPTGTPEEREQAKVKLAAARQRLEMLSGLIKEEEGGIPSIPGKAPPPPPGFVKQ